MPLTDFNRSAVAVGIVTAIAGLIAYWLTRFSFLFFTVVAAALNEASVAAASPRAHLKATFPVATS